MGEKKFIVYKFKRIIKYLLFAFSVFMILRYLPNTFIDSEEILTLSLSIAVVYGIMDIFYPSIRIT